MIAPERVQRLNDKPVRPGRFVLYWMQASQRAQDNHALEYAAGQANALGQPLVAVFGLTGDYPRANLRHYTFMLQGLAETADALTKRGIQLVVRLGPPAEAALAMAEPASLVVADRGYLRHQTAWRARLARRSSCHVVQVESDAVVPVETASDRLEYAARTFRPRHRRHRRRFLKPLRRVPLRKDSLDLRLGATAPARIISLLGRLNIDRTLPVSREYLGGAAEARRRLAGFIADGLARYGRCRNDPGLNVQSHMSPYLHFGQISPLRVALAVAQARGCPAEGKEAYLEELLIRRELSLNYVHYQPRYDSYAALPGWARATLRAHRRDKRPRVYTRREMEAAQTDDAYWNAAMIEMVVTGKMHNYMRMYWGKKIIEWTRSPAAAFRTMLDFNDRYFLDGRDPASYANVAWCFGLHDRPWPQRPVFGTVRYMNAAGLERKFDMAAYVERVGDLASR